MLHRTLKIMERDVSKNFCSHLFFKFFTLVQNTQILSTHYSSSPPFIREKREREEEKDGENDEQQESSDKISQSLFLTSCAVVSRL